VIISRRIRSAASREIGETPFFPRARVRMRVRMKMRERMKEHKKKIVERAFTHVAPPNVFMNIYLHEEWKKI